MTTTEADIAQDNAIAELHDEAMMERAAREQAILVLVEGDSEEAALPILFTEASDAGRLVGLKIANYNGNGSLVAFMRLLIKTLSHPHPIILTYDNDPGSLAAFERCQRQGLIASNVFAFAIPSVPVVQYSNGQKGGSFEEAFSPETFLAAAFHASVLPQQLVNVQSEFAAEFDPSRPWLGQLQKFCALRDFTDWATKKPVLAERLAEGADPIPQTFADLISLIEATRKKFPVIHPHDVELPKVRGLTC